MRAPHSSEIPVNRCAPGFRLDLAPAAASATPRHRFAPRPATESALRVPPAAQLESRRSAEPDLLVPGHVPLSRQAAYPAFAELAINSPSIADRSRFFERCRSRCTNSSRSKTRRASCSSSFMRLGVDSQSLRINHGSVSPCTTSVATIRQNVR